MTGIAVLQRTYALTRHRRLSAIALATAIAALSPSLCSAQCVELSERTPQIDLQMFVAEPGLLLRQLRNNKEQLTGRLTHYLTTDPSLLPSVRQLVREAQAADRPAIGEALRLAESRCITTQPEASRRIGEFVRKLGDLTVLAGYSAAAEEPAPPPSPRAKSPGSSAGLMSGEWSTEIKDPFAPMPIPQ